MRDKPSIYDQLDLAIESLHDTELEVLLEVAEALQKGQDDYGGLDLYEDPRDFVREAWDEDRDWLAYRAMQIVQDRKRNGGRDW